MTWLEVPGKPKLLRSEGGTFTIFCNDRYSPPIFNATQWVPSSDTKRTLGRFDSLEEAQKACEGAV